MALTKNQLTEPILKCIFMLLMDNKIVFKVQPALCPGGSSSHNE